MAEGECGFAYKLGAFKQNRLLSKANKRKLIGLGGNAKPSVGAKEVDQRNGVALIQMMRSSGRALAGVNFSKRAALRTR